MGSGFLINMLNKIEVDDSDTQLESSMAALAAAMSDASRVKMLCALMDGRAWTATELSAVADIASSTASSHLNRLVNSHLITCLSQGRHRYYRLAGHEVGQLVEMMMGVSWKRIPPPKTRTPVQLRVARTCYDHLAGEVAVEIYESMRREGWINDDGTHLTEKGHENFQQMGVVLDPKTKRKPCCACLDWSERRSHLGGDAGAAFFTLCEHRGWLKRVQGFREVNITSSGKAAFRKWFALSGNPD
jgi:DNA-binding transcriptional ArsR family regulator